MPSEKTRHPLFRTPRFTLRNLGLIVVAYVLYGTLLLGTSAIIADPEHSVTRTQDFLPGLLFGDSLAPTDLSAAGTVQLNSATH